MQHDLPDRRVHQPEGRQAREREHVREQSQELVEQADQHLEDRPWRRRRPPRAAQTVAGATAIAATREAERLERARVGGDTERRQAPAPTSSARPGTPESAVSAQQRPPSRKRLTIPIT